MDCQRIGDEQLQADKMDLLYGEADAEVRARMDAHLAECASCREELAGLRQLRGRIAAWQPPRPRVVSTPRGIVVPRWLAAAAALLLGISLPLGATGYVAMRRALRAQEERTAALEASQRRAQLALQQALAGRATAVGAPAALLAEVDARVDERMRASEERQAQRLDVRLAEWNARVDAQRRVDLARVAEGLSYLDGQHGQQLARTNELMGYVLSAASQKR